MSYTKLMKNEIETIQDISSSLASETRKAYNHMMKLEHSNVSVLLVEREAARKAYEAAKKAEFDFWNPPSEEL